MTNATQGKDVRKLSETDIKVKQAIENDNRVSEAIAALQVLGYNKRLIEKAFEKIENKKNYQQKI